MAFPILAYISPLLIGLIIPLVISTGNSAKTTLLRTVIVAGVVISGIGVFSLFAPATNFRLDIVGFLELAVFLITWAGVISGVMHLCLALKITPPLAQLIAYVGVFKTTTLVFWANPVIESFAHQHSLRQAIIKMTVYSNPILTIAGNFFRHDILRSTKMYSISVIGPYYSYGYAAWWLMAIFYCLIALICYVLASLIIRRRSNAERQRNI